MKHKTAELEDALLDAAVAKAEGFEPATRGPIGNFSGRADRKCYFGVPPRYSTDWSLAGPLIEAERIALARDDDGRWFAGVCEGLDGGGDVMLAGMWSTGPTPLIAAMRAFVASKFGDEVELPA